MATGAVNKSQSSSVLDQLTSKLNGGNATEAKKKPNEVGKDEFLKMLVEQLKGQDPTNPMNSDQFAVNLAQFSQLEQLVDINKKMGGTTVADSASLAAFLGKEVVVDGSKAQVNEGDAGSVYFELPSALQSSTLQLIDGSGNVVEEKDLGQQISGRHNIPVKNLEVPNGEYTLKLTGITFGGESVTPELSTGGVVTGFIPGADPSLLLGNKAVKTADIKSVNSVA